MSRAAAAAEERRRGRMVKTENCMVGDVVPFGEVVSESAVRSYAGRVRLRKLDDALNELVSGAGVK